MADDHRADSLGQDKSCCFFCWIQIQILFTSRKAIFFPSRHKVVISFDLAPPSKCNVYEFVHLENTKKTCFPFETCFFFFAFFIRNNRTMNSVRAPVVFNWYRSVFYAFLAKCTIKLFWEQVWSVCISLQATLQLCFSYSPNSSPPNSAQAEAGHWVHLEKETAEQTKRTERERIMNRGCSLFSI